MIRFVIPKSKQDLSFFIVDMEMPRALAFSIVQNKSKVPKHIHVFIASLEAQGSTHCAHYKCGLPIHVPMSNRKLILTFNKNEQEIPTTDSILLS